MSQTLSKKLTSRRTALKSFFLATMVATIGITAPMQAFAEDKTIKVGIMGGEDENVWAVVAEQAKKNGLNLELVIFNDYNQPNEALARKEIDANSFQHKPYLDAQIDQHGYDISVAGYTAVWPIGIYSRKIKDLSELKDGAVVGVPNDPSNEGRALRVLEEKELIKLRPDAGILATPIDIVENPKKLDIRELDAGVVGRSIDDLDIAIVNNDWALKAELTPDDAIAWESNVNNPYNNFIAVRSDDLNSDWVKALVASYQNDAVKAELDRAYKGTGIPAWE